MFGETGENPVRARRRKINQVTSYSKLQLEEKSLREKPLRRRCEKGRAGISELISLKLRVPTERYEQNLKEKNYEKNKS